MNTCESVSKQVTLTCFRINTYRKPGEGGPTHTRRPTVPSDQAQSPTRALRIRKLSALKLCSPSIFSNRRYGWNLTRRHGCPSIEPFCSFSERNFHAVCADSGC